MIKGFPTLLKASMSLFLATARGSPCNSGTGKVTVDADVFDREVGAEKSLNLVDLL